jgi:hypothetical protein
VAKPKKLPPPSADLGNKQLADLETPGVKWNIVLQIGAALVGLWVFAFLLVPYVGYWGVGVVAALTLVGAGFAVYLYTLTRRSRRVVEILKGATDEAGRKAAIAQLADVKGNDAMAALARAQLVARDDPKQAMEILESIDIGKAGPQAEDEVRSNLAYMYLIHNRPKDARPLVDKLRLDRQPQAKAKAMYAAVSAETLARTGDAAEAKKLVETYRADDPEYGEIAIMLLRAQVFTFMATKNRGLARRAAAALAERDPNMLAPFLGKGTTPEMQAMAREVLSETGYATRQKMKVQRK